MSGKINTVTWKIAALCSLIKCSFFKAVLGRRGWKQKQSLLCLHCKHVDISGDETHDWRDSVPTSVLLTNMQTLTR